LDVPAIGASSSGPASMDASAIYWNPAMLGFMKQGEVFAGLGVVAGQISYERNRLGTYQYSDSLVFNEPIDAAYLDASKTGSAGLAKSPVASPWGEVFAAYPVIPDRMTAGLGFYVPYAAPLNFPEDGPQRWQLQQAFIAVTRLTGSLAVKVHERVSLGAGVSYVFGLASLRKVQDFAAVDDLANGLSADPLNQENVLGQDAPATVRELEVLSRPISFTDGTSHGISFNVGAAFRPIDPLTIGIDYDHGERVRFKGDFALDMNDDFFTQDLASEGLQFSPLVEGEGELSFRMAKRVMLGLGYQLNERVLVGGNFAFVMWSDLDAFDFDLSSPDLAQPTLGIPDSTSVALTRDWKNTVHAELNTTLGLDKKGKMNLNLVAGYHSPASPDSTIDVASPDGHRLIGAAGLGIRINPRVALLVDAEVQGILPREVTASDYDLGNGTYRLLLASSSLHLQAKFGGKTRETKPQVASEEKPAEASEEKSE
jgi:long-chain fatty acid transport protein